jgi:hypothetical protein
MSKYSPLELTRRQLLTTATIGVGTLVLPPSELFADDAGLAGLVERRRLEAPNAKLSLVPLRGGLTVLSGAGGNIAVLTGAEGKLMVDSGIAGTNRRLSRRWHLSIRSLSSM